MGTEKSKNAPQLEKITTSTTLEICSIKKFNKLGIIGKGGFGKVSIVIK